jgi:hypothetical protein
MRNISMFLQTGTTTSKEVCKTGGRHSEEFWMVRSREEGLYSGGWITYSTSYHWKVLCDDSDKAGSRWGCVWRGMIMRNTPVEIIQPH